MSGADVAGVASAPSLPPARCSTLTTDRPDDVVRAIRDLLDMAAR